MFGFLSNYIKKLKKLRNAKQPTEISAESPPIIGQFQFYNMSKLAINQTKTHHKDIWSISVSQLPHTTITHRASSTNPYHHEAQ